MLNHAPIEYKCPICLAISGVENEDTWIAQSDIFYRDELVVGFISSKAVKGNEAHALVVPVKHFENLYEMPAEYGHRVFEISKEVAKALKQTRNCDGVTILQNNEPAGDQHAFHYHMHVFPRFTGDMLHEELMRGQRSTPEQRLPHAKALKEYFSSWSG